MGNERREWRVSSDWGKPQHTFRWLAVHSAKRDGYSYVFLSLLGVGLTVTRWAR